MLNDIGGDLIEHQSEGGFHSSIYPHSRINAVTLNVKACGVKKIRRRSDRFPDRCRMPHTDRRGGREIRLRKLCHEFMKIPDRRTPSGRYHARRLPGDYRILRVLLEAIGLDSDHRQRPGKTVMEISRQPHPKSLLDLSLSPFSTHGLSCHLEAKITDTCCNTQESKFEDYAWDIRNCWASGQCDSIGDNHPLQGNDRSKNRSTRSDRILNRHVDNQPRQQKMLAQASCHQHTDDTQWDYSPSTPNQQQRNNARSEKLNEDTPRHGCRRQQRQSNDHDSEKRFSASMGCGAKK